MKAKKRIRVLRALAIAGSMSAFAVPSAALARPNDDVPFRAENQQAVHTQYQLPASFHSEVQSSAKPYSPPSGFKPEVQNSSAPTVASTPGSIVREIRTVTDDGSPTLAIVLAAIALAIALCGSAYAWVRLTRLQRAMSSRALVG
jgi:hypothetical protein